MTKNPYTIVYWSIGICVDFLWREPFNYNYYNSVSIVNTKFSMVINTLLSCVNEEEISSLYRTLNFNNKTPLFEYVRKINHEYCVQKVLYNSIET